MKGFRAVRKIKGFRAIGLLFVWLPVCHVVFPGYSPRVKRSDVFVAFYTLPDSRPVNQRAGN